MRFILTFLKLAFITLIISSCNKKADNFKIITITERVSINNSDNFIQEALGSNSYSMRYEHFNERYVKGQHIMATLNIHNDSILIINNTTKNLNKIKLPFKYNVPVGSIYFHNYDSIFVFIDRESKIKARDYDVFWDDFILIDSAGKVNDRYNLDSVRFIYNGQLDPMIFKRKWITTQNMIRNEKLYIPFSLYRPSISNVKLGNLDISLLCEYDLKTKKVKMLDVKVPDSDIGIKYLEKVVDNSLDYYIHGNSIYYSFFYSSSIYRYDIFDKEVEKLNSYPEFPFNNVIIGKNDSLGQYETHFFSPVYSSENDIFVREISVNNYKDFERFKVSQMLDSEFRLIGYHFEDSLYSNIKVGPFGNLLVLNKATRDYFIVKDFNVVNKINKKEVEGKILDKKITEKDYRNERGSYTQRVNDYLDSLGLLRNGKDKKIILISTNIVCSDCIDHLFSKYKELSNKDFVYVLFGSDIDFIEKILHNYRIDVDDKHIYIDKSKTYSNYLREKEYNLNSFVNITKDSIQVIKYDIKNIEDQFDSFLRI